MNLIIVLMKGCWEKEESQTDRELVTRTTGWYEGWETKEKEIKLIYNKKLSDKSYANNTMWNSLCWFYVCNTNCIFCIYHAA